MLAVVANAAVLEDIIIDGANEAAFATTTMPLLVLPPLPLFMMDKTAASISTADDDDEVELVIMDHDRFALLLLVADIGSAAAGAIGLSISNLFKTRSAEEEVMVREVCIFKERGSATCCWLSSLSKISNLLKIGASSC